MKKEQALIELENIKKQRRFCPILKQNCKKKYCMFYCNPIAQQVYVCNDDDDGDYYEIIDEKCKYFNDNIKIENNSKASLF